MAQDFALRRIRNQPELYRFASQLQCGLECRELRFLRIIQQRHSQITPRSRVRGLRQLLESFQLIVARASADAYARTG